MLRQATDGPSADGTYKGMNDYIDYRQGFRREHTIGNEKGTGLHGPLRASTNVRMTVRFDYQPDICKDYKETGFCGYGDACKFIHDRSDYKSGWELDKVCTLLPCFLGLCEPQVVSSVQDDESSHSGFSCSLVTAACKCCICSAVCAGFDAYVQTGDGCRKSEVSHREFGRLSCRDSAHVEDMCASAFCRSGMSGRRGYRRQNGVIRSLGTRRRKKMTRCPLPATSAGSPGRKLPALL